MQTDQPPAWHRRTLSLPRWWPFGLIGLGLAVRVPMLGFRSMDWNLFISGWMRALHQHGLHAFQHPFSDYSFPYLFLLWTVGHLGVGDLLAVKLLSIAIDALLAVAAATLARQLWPTVRPVAAAAVVFALPTVVLNGALWGQCDALYASLAVFAIAFACRESWRHASVLLGAALAIKLQTVFVIPALLIIWWHRDRRLRTIAVGCGSFGILTLPPVLFGEPLTSVLNTYREQSGEYRALTLNAPNLYQWWHWSPRAGEITATVLTALALAAVLALAMRGRLQTRLRQREPFSAAVTGLCCALCAGLPFVFPHMHERYFYLAEVLAAVLGFGRPSALRAAVLLQISTTLAYLPFLTGRTPVPLSVAAIGTLAAVALLATLARRDLAAHASAATRTAATPPNYAEAEPPAAEITGSTLAAQ